MRIHYQTNASTYGLGHDLSADWRVLAACRDVDPELFFPIGSGALAETQTELAKAVCHRCPVRGDCLTWALTTGEDHGIWGGLTEDERRKAKRRGVAAARG